MTFIVYVGLLLIAQAINPDWWATYYEEHSLFILVIGIVAALDGGYRTIKVKVDK
jgi:hypothetical protein